MPKLEKMHIEMYLSISELAPLQVESAPRAPKKEMNLSYGFSFCSSSFFIFG